MAKTNQQIIGSVRIGGDVFRAGMEDAFADVATPEQIHRLTEQGVIAGFETTGKPPATAPTPAPAVTTDTEPALDKDRPKGKDK